ncbi:MAG TPA: DUF4129 domain-containing protein [Stellaceae bacterium]|nr:DUF4129 domain-containing protein [Stellaceae bacterium]
METTWLYAWALVIARAFGEASPGFLAMVLLFALGAWAGRLSRLAPWRPPWGRLLLVPATIAVLPAWLYAAPHAPGGWDISDWSALLSARNGALVGTVLVALYLWGRGLWIGVWPPSTRTLGKWLVGGAAAFVALFALLAADHDSGVAPIAGRLELLVLGYFVLGLSVIALVHTETLHGRSSAGQPISLSWAVALAVPMAAIAALGLLFSSDLAPVVRAILAPVVRAAAAAALALGNVLLWIGAWLLMFLHWLSSLFLAGAPGALRRGSLQLPPPSHSALGILDQIVLLFVYALLLGLMAAGLASLFLRVLLYLRGLFRRGRAARDRADRVEEERSSLWSWQLFRNQVRGVWAALFGRVRNGYEALAGRARAAVADRTGEPDPADIREIYRRLLRWAAARGYPRRAAATPHELWRQISAAVPVASAALALITANYERARYGDSEVTGSALAASRAASEEIAKANSHSAGVGARR